MQRLHTHSQNFLRSPALVKELIGHTNIKKTDVVFDIGAGSGVITSVLAQKAARVVAIEIDERFIPKLHANLQKYDNVEIVCADVLVFQFPDEPYKIFANIPFSLSSPIVTYLFNTPTPPRAAYLIVQEQFARRLIPGKNGHVSQLGAMLAAKFDMRIRRHMRPTDFYPRPHVPTVLLEMRYREAEQASN
jgi:23S rRNA (adenine-N6)-dimethyltransferase